MPDDLEQQLRAYGQTLAHESGEPIERPAPPVTRIGSRRRWAVLGAAACIVAALVGVVVLAQRPDQDVALTPPPTTVLTPDTAPVVTVPDTTTTTIELAPLTERVPADPLGLERDGWMLVQRDTDPLDFSEVEGLCPAADFGVSGSEQVHDILTPPDSEGLDLDVQIIRVGSLERGNRLGEALLMLGRCAGESVGIEAQIGAMSSERATWVRVGSDFALVTVVGEGDLTIVLEIEGNTFDDDLIGDLVHRAGAFLSPPSDTEDPVAFVLAQGPPVGAQQVEPVPGEVQLFVSNQSFEDVFTVAAEAPTWAVLDYWYYPDDPEGRHFTFGVFDQPVQFA